MTSAESLGVLRADHTDGMVSGYSSGQVTPTGLSAPTFSAGISADPADPRYPIHLSWSAPVGVDSSTVYDYKLEYQSSTSAGPGQRSARTQSVSERRLPA
jgi:hypothetical protein